MAKAFLHLVIEWILNRLDEWKKAFLVFGRWGNPNSLLFIPYSLLFSFPI